MRKSAIALSVEAVLGVTDYQRVLRAEYAKLKYSSLPLIRTPRRMGKSHCIRVARELLLSSGSTLRFLETRSNDRFFIGVDPAAEKDIGCTATVLRDSLTDELRVVSVGYCGVFE
ncbi:hypothetical protein EXT51_21380 [Pectobacterium carotovorum subsp. carotovorum]|uniref:hypothetical protein n=1 Tax=Pectobacterium carotovorum TaxID=554 RepID=UPI00202D413E|nr:hypothetical protein [Pectobacterium carotovorum]MCL6332032.1 hypothetical protein [Pectobacterium carotovorum subsp. carotovorum]